MGTFISNEKDAIDIRHIVAVDTDEDGQHTVLTDCGWRIGVTDEMFQKDYDGDLPQLGGSMVRIHSPT